MANNKKVYTLYTKGPKPIKYEVSFADEPEDWSLPAKLFLMMARDRIQEKRITTLNSDVASVI